MFVKNWDSDFSLDYQRSTEDKTIFLGKFKKFFPTSIFRGNLVKIFKRIWSN